MSTCVCVLSNNGERLMPTIRLGRVRHLLKDGKAKIIKHHPFTIQLLYDSKTNTQPIEICEDVGYNYIGISVKSQSHEYVSAQYDTLQDEKACHDSCRKLRRTRRNRLRYRKPRFDNRKRGEGWLAPSLKHKKELNVNVVKMYCTVMPITHATVEVGSFDTIAQTTRCLVKKLKAGIEQSKEQIPTSFSNVFWVNNAEDILMYAASCDPEWIASAYKQIRERLGLLGYYFCKFFASQDNHSYCKTDLLTDFLREASIDFKKAAIANKMEQFLRTYILLPESKTLYLFSVDSVRNYYGSFETYKPVSKYLLSAVAAQYEAESVEPTFEDMDYLLKDAQYALFTDRCQNAKTEEDAFTIISHLEKQPQTFKKLLFAKEYFKNVYALLNDTDKMFADIVISDCPGCTKLLKSLQNFAEEQSKNV